MPSPNALNQWFKTLLLIHHLQRLPALFPGPPWVEMLTGSLEVTEQSRHIALMGQSEATLKIAARLRSTSASVVAHDDTLMRIAV